MAKNKNKKKAAKCVSVLWFEQNLGPQARKEVEKLCKKFGLELMDGVKTPTIMTIERGR